MKIPFVKPYLTGNELKYISQLQTLCGDGFYTKACHRWLEENTGALKALLSHSCTAALEMAALLIDTQPGDEIIMPSYTFVSTANAFVLRGGVPVFVDIRPDTLNMDEKLIEAAITDKTKAIVPVHYAGVSCEMDSILEIANQYGLSVIEDAAQGVMARYKGRPLGTLGHLGAYSFHETKNIISGEGGALLINKAKFCELAEIIREKGTDRTQFFLGHVDKYTWQHVGSSYLPSELIAAFLYAQFEEAELITKKRLSLWNGYHSNFEKMEREGLIQRPVVPTHCQHNAHMYYLLVNDAKLRHRLIAYLRKLDIYAVFHYIPLHSSPAGIKYGRTNGCLTYTDSLSERIVRLPLYADMDEATVNRITEAVTEGMYHYKLA